MEKAGRLAATCCLVISLLLACSPQGPRPQPNVSVPNVVSMWLGEAHFALEHAGLSPVDDTDMPWPSGAGAIAMPFALCVLVQTPSAATVVAKGTVVRLRAGFDSRCGKTKASA